MLDVLGDDQQSCLAVIADNAARPSVHETAAGLLLGGDAWVGPTLGRPSECVLVSDIVYNG